MTSSPRLVLGLAQAFNSLSFAKNGHSSLPEILELVYAERCHQAYVITKRESTSSNDEILLLAALICCQDEKIPREDILNVLVSRMERALSMDKELVFIKGSNKRDIERVASEIAAMLSRQILKEVVYNDEDGATDVFSRMLPLRRVLAAAAQVGLLSDQGHESSISAVLYAAIINCLLHSARSTLSSPNETRKQRLKQTSLLVDAASMFLEDALTVLSLTDVEFFGNNLSSSHELLETFPMAILDKKRMISSVEADAAELLLVLVSGGAIDSKHGPGSVGALGLRKMALELIAPSTSLSVDEAQSFTQLDRSLSNLLEASRWAGN